MNSLWLWFEWFLPLTNVLFVYWSMYNRFTFWYVITSFFYMNFQIKFYFFYEDILYVCPAYSIKDTKYCYCQNIMFMTKQSARFLASLTLSKRCAKFLDLPGLPYAQDLASERHISWGFDFHMNCEIMGHDVLQSDRDLCSQKRIS